MDGDGSTITHDNKLPDNLRDLILTNQHVKWMMATGRSMDLLRITPIFQYLNNEIFHIVDGGSCLMYKDGTIHKHYQLQDEEINLLFRKLNLDLTNYMYYSPNGKQGFAYTKDEEIKSRLLKISDHVSVCDDIAQLRKWLHEYPTGKILLNVKEEFDLSGLHYNQNENNFDFTSLGVNKGSAFFEMLQTMELTPEETVFVFNDKNDLPIVEHPELSNVIKIKVGNYLPDITSDYHVDTPHEVADVLSKLI